MVGRKWFWIIHLLISGGAALCIVGGVGDNTNTPSTKLKAGIIVYVVSFMAVTILYAIAVSQRLLVPRVEQRTFLAVGIALPFVAVRLLYSVLADFSYNHDFSAIGGNVGILVGMATVEEFVVVLDYVILGYTLQTIAKQEQTQQMSNWKPLASPRAV